jgi:hypothetical protein
MSTGEALHMVERIERLNITLSPELRGKLNEASQTSGKSIAEEVRARLDWLFGVDWFEPVDKPTMDLLRSFAMMGVELERETGQSWHTNPGTHAAFKQAITTRLDRLKPEGEIVGSWEGRAHQALPLDDPAEIGTVIEFDDLEIHHLEPAERKQRRLSKEKVFQALRELRQRKQEGGK